MHKVGIINVTGYIGMELARLLSRHPGVELVSVTGRSAVGQRLGELVPHLATIDLVIAPELGDVEVAFSALPHRTSAQAVAAALEGGARVVDLSADFRLTAVSEYEQWYETVHPAPHLIGEAVYGLVELARPSIPPARLVASPGCYPTGALLALAPAVKEGLIEPDIVIDAKSGVSGAGRTPSLATHFAEANESCSAYALEGHRHLPEIVQGLRGFDPGLGPRVTFVPHLVPMSRGILTTCYAHLKEGMAGKVRALYSEFYLNEPFVRVVDVPPATKQTLGTNVCLVYPTVDARTGRLIVVSCIDNLVKGGAGQAVQAMNLMLGLPEAQALEAAAVYP